MFVLTRLGRSLRKARKTKRLDRPAADRAVAQLLAAAEEINADPNLIFWVEEIDLFGSYVEDAADYGDVDAAVSFTRRLGNRAWVEESQRRAHLANRQNLIEQLCWGELEVYRRLRRACRQIDLQPKECVTELGCRFQPLFRRAKPLSEA